MAIAEHTIDARAASVAIDDEFLLVTLVDGRLVRVPLSWFPRLAAGTPEQRGSYRIIEDGRAINFPDLDEDIGVEPLLAT